MLYSLPYAAATPCCGQTGLQSVGGAEVAASSVDTVGAAAVEDWSAARRAFMMSLVSLLKHYRKFVVYPTKVRTRTLDPYAHAHARRPSPPLYLFCLPAVRNSAGPQEAPEPLERFQANKFLQVGAVFKRHGWVG